MKLIVTCGVCGLRLVEIDKPMVTQEDEDMYQNNTVCDVDGNTLISLRIEGQ